LVHREFSNSFPATLTIYKDKVVTENWNKPAMLGLIKPSNLKPHPQNPTLANFFRQLGWVEELGSGVRNMFKFCPIYVTNSLPIIEEGDIFKITIQYEGKDTQELGQELGQELERELNEKTLFSFILQKLENGDLSRKEIAISFGQNKISGYMNRMLPRLITLQLIENTIPDNLNHPAQKFKLTARGKKFLQLINGW
jgi:ATP-dependent DNA helicase RecG